MMLLGARSKGQLAAADLEKRVWQPYPEKIQTPVVNRGLARKHERAQPVPPKLEHFLNRLYTDCSL